MSMVISYGISLSNTCISVPLGIFLDAIDFICLIDNNPGHLMNLDTISRFMFIGSLQLGHFLDLELRRFSLVSKNRTVTIEGWPIIKKTASMGSPVLGLFYRLIFDKYDSQLLIQCHRTENGRKYLISGLSLYSEHAP